jgi:uncharacterized protein (DUF58 family)
MIVPRYKLLFWVGMVFLPFATLAAAVPSAANLSGGLIGALFVLVFMDAFLAFGTLDGISVELPEVVRLSKDCQGEIELRINNGKMKVGRVRLGLPFPLEIYSPNQDITAELPRQSPSSSLSWPCKAYKRGRYVLDKCYLEHPSPLGFWAARSSIPGRTEIRVYPNIFPERKNLAALFLNRGGLGIHAQRQVGKGREFEHLRDYLPDDSYEDIHWKATAKRGHPITKVYQVERTQEVYIIIDASRLSARSADHLNDRRFSEENGGDGPMPTTFERYVTAALIMGLAAERQGDLFGILTFSDRVRAFVRARNGKAHYNACREALYTLQPQGVTPDFSELFTFIGSHLRRRALLVFLTNLDDLVLAESFVQNIHLICRRHLVLANMLKPQGAKPLFFSPSVKSVDDMYRSLAGHFLWAGLRETEKVLQRSGVGFSMLDNEKMCTQLVSQYLSIKQRQML